MPDIWKIYADLSASEPEAAFILAQNFWEMASLLILTACAAGNVRPAETMTGTLANIASHPALTPALDDSSYLAVNLLHSQTDTPLLCEAVRLLAAGVECSKVLLFDKWTMALEAHECAGLRRIAYFLQNSLSPVLLERCLYLLAVICPRIHTRRGVLYDNTALLEALEALLATAASRLAGRVNSSAWEEEDAAADQAVLGDTALCYALGLVVVHPSLRPFDL